MSDSLDTTTRLDDWLDDAATAGDAAELSRWVVADAAHADAAARALQLHASLRLMMKSSAAGGSSETIASPIAMAIVTAKPASRPRGRWAAYSAAAAALIGGVVVAVIAVVGGGGAVDSPAHQMQSPPVAVLLDSEGVNWTSDPIEPGDPVPARHLAIASGRLEINLNGGTAVDLIGPAQMSLTGGSSVRLMRGSLHADAVPGFTVVTPGGVRITDLGTRFIVTVGADGGVRVGVVDGRVACRDAAGADRELTQRSVMAFDPAGVLIERIDEPAGVDTAAMYVFDRDGDGGGDAPADAGPSPVRSLVGGPTLESAGDGVYIGDLPLGDATDNWLIEARVRADSTDGIGILAYHGDSAVSGFGLVRQGDRWALVCGGVTVIDFGVTVELGRWTHLAAVRQGGVTRLYVDGRPVGQPAQAAPRPSTQRLSIGGRGDEKGGQMLGGRIDRVRIARLTAAFDPTMLMGGGPTATRLDDGERPTDGATQPAGENENGSNRVKPL